MHLSTKSTWHHHTVPFQSLKSCKISRGSCQHNATSAFTAVGSTYHYLHCKHFDITLTQPALLEIQDTSPTLYLLKERTKWVFDQILNRTVLTTKLWNKYSGYFFFLSALKTSLRKSWTGALPHPGLSHRITKRAKNQYLWQQKSPIVKMSQLLLPYDSHSQNTSLWR